MSTRSFRSLLLFCVLGSCLATGVLQGQPAPASRVLQAVDNSVRVTLRGNTHPLARPEFDRGEAPANLPLNRMLLVLKRSDQQEVALLRLMENQQYKKSPSYHQWLTPVDFGARFGPSDADIAAVTNWLQSSGFQLAQVSKGRTVIEFSGTAGLVKQAFGTAIHKFVVKGEEHWANVNDPSIPAALTPVVAGVDSLHNFPKKPMSRSLGEYSMKTKQLTSPNPDYTVGCGTSSTCYAVTPFDFATIYDLLPLWNATTPINGTGQTIAIVGQTDINPSDATTFWKLFGLDGSVPQRPTPTLTITYNGPNPGFISDEGEADLDTQWSGAAAPGATIHFVTSATTETTGGVDLSALYIIDNNVAPVMSESYGQCELALGSTGVSFYAGLWEQAAAQGITALLSSGDGGAAGCDDFNTSTAAQNGLAVSGFASTPFNVAVGGTDFNQFQKETTYWNTANDPTTQQSAKGYIPETTWNDSCTNSLLQFLRGGSTNPETNCNNPNFAGFHDIVSGSGGVSAAWPKPAWQTGNGVPNDNARDVPDVSLFASDGFLGSFYTFCKTDQTSGVCNLNALLGAGGTSISSPAFAGIMALVNQKWGPQGNANFVLYKLAAKPLNAFHDTPAGSTISVPCVPASPNCNTSTSGDQLGVLSGYGTTAGYDRATGLGSVDAANLVNDWNMVTFTPTTTTLTLNSGSAVNVTHGTGVKVTVGVTPTAATGDVALLVSPKPGSAGIDGFTLTGGTASWTTTLLPGGTYPVIAHYAGDGTYGGSYSSPSANITVGAEKSIVFMPGVDTGTDTNGNPVYSSSVGYGTPYFLRADVQNAAGSFCGPGSGVACPTGTIAFTDNGSALDAGTYTLNSGGYTEDFAIQLNGGPNTLVAKYNGDSSYKTSIVTTMVTVAKAATHISNVQGIAVAQPGVAFAITATVVSASSGVAPTGSVSFFANGTLLPGTVQLTPTNGPNASLGASLNATINTPGNYNITATYSGDSNYANVTASNAFPMEVYDFTTSVPADPLAANPGQSASATMMVTPVAAAAFTNDVTFSCSGLTGATCTFSPAKITAGGGATNVTITIQTAGPFTGIAGGARIKHSADNRRPWLALTLPLVGIVFLGLAVGRLPRRSRTATGMTAGLALVAFLVSCGGGGSSGPPAVSVSVSPRTVNTLYPNLTINGTAAPAQTQQFSATVSSSTTQSVTWAVAGGSTNGAIDASGLYTAPPALPATSAVTIIATASADTSKSGSATVTLLAPTPPGNYPITVSVVEGQLQKTTSFNLAVN